MVAELVEAVWQPYYYYGLITLVANILSAFLTTNKYVPLDRLWNISPISIWLMPFWTTPRFLLASNFPSKEYRFAVIMPLCSVSIST